MIRRGSAIRAMQILVIVICCTCLAPLAQAGTYAPKVGSAHPQIILPKVGGGELALSNLRGKKVLLIHFATWSEECRKLFPNWLAQTKPFVDTEKLVVVGITQEQHADRVQLFAQWQKAEWPILIDAMNVIGVSEVPFIVAIDEHGVVRKINPSLDKIEDGFIKRTYEPLQVMPPIDREELPDPRITRRTAGEARKNTEWRKHAEALMYAGKPQQIDEAISTLKHAIENEDDDAAAWFAQGVLFRVRHDRSERQPQDFQTAIDAWRKAAGLIPENAIYRARVQQYGPCTDKPFTFYDWIEQAQRNIKDRGETPIELTCEPVGSEALPPAKKFRYRKKAGPDSDALRKAARDMRPIVEVTNACAAELEKRRGGIVQVYVTCRLAPGGNATWSNEGEPMQMWIEKPKTGRVGLQYVAYPQPKEPRSQEERVLSFPLRLASAKSSITLEATLLYFVHDGPNAPAQPMKQDLRIKVKVH